MGDFNSDLTFMDDFVALWCLSQWFIFVTGNILKCGSITYTNLGTHLSDDAKKLSAERGPARAAINRVLARGTASQRSQGCFDVMIP